MDNALVPGLGGPMGRYAYRRGVWFDPLPWVLLTATLMFIALVVRHAPCVQTDAANQTNVYIWLCYSDIQPTFNGLRLGQGASPVAGGQLAASPLLAVLMALIVFAISNFGGVIGPAATPQEITDASVAFFAVSAVVLFICFLVAVLAVARYAMPNEGYRFSWVGWLFAASPIVFAVGLIDWTLLGLSIAAVGVLCVRQGRLMEGGVALGIAASAATMPIAIGLAAVLAVGLSDGLGRGLRLLGAALGTFFAIHLPLLLSDARRVYSYYHAEINADRGQDTADVTYGSIWYLVSHLGVPLREFGALLFVCLLLGLAILVGFLYARAHRPAVASMVAAVILLTSLFGLSFTPQTGLWVLLAVLLARPYRAELIALSCTQVAYTVAIWLRLGGYLAEPAEPALGLHLWYWAAILAQVSVQVWLLVRVVADLTRTIPSPTPVPYCPASQPRRRNDGSPRLAT